MNILITGGAGYIGSHIVEQLSNTKNNLTILDNLSTGYKKLIHKKARFIKGDIRDKKLLMSIIKKYNIHTIIHLAALLNVSESEKKKLLYKENNINGTKNLLIACKNSNVKNFIFSSTCAVYGNVKGKVSENKKLNPKNYYGYTKFQAENLIKEYSKKYKFKYSILRYFNVAGASNSKQIGEIHNSHGHLIKNLAIQSLKKKPKIFVYGNNYSTKDGTCIRDYIHVLDLADIHIRSLGQLNSNKKSFIINCGYGIGYSVLEVANIFKKFKKNIKIIISDRRLGDVPEVYSDTKKLKKILKWKPNYNNIVTIIKSAILWEKKLKNIL